MSILTPGSVRSCSCALTATLERAGTPDFRWHDLRHCYGSWLAMSGTTGKAATELMGHKDPKMTLQQTRKSPCPSPVRFVVVLMCPPA
jgi:integrase